MSRETLRALAAAATPGPWKKRLPGWLGPDRHKWGCVFFGPSPDEVYTTSPLVPADAAFIAASRTAVPLLLDIADAAAALADSPDTTFREMAGQWSRLRAALAALAALEGSE